MNQVALEIKHVAEKIEKVELKLEGVEASIVENDDGIKANKEIMKKARSGSSKWKSASSDNERLYKKEESLREEKKQLREKELQLGEEKLEKEKQLSEKEKQLSEKEKQRTAEKELEVLKKKKDQEVKRPKVAFPENIEEAWERTKDLGAGVDIVSLLNTKDIDAQKTLLGGLFKEGETLPVLNGRIDMRLYNSENGKRAASKLLSEKLTLGESLFFLIAVSGSGKTSSLFELGSDHYLIYAQCTDDTDSNPGSIEDDINFARMLSNIRADLGDSEEDNWVLAERRCKLDIIARTFTLFWLWKQLDRKPEPREYLLFQLTGKGAAFIREIRTKFGSIDSVSLDDVDNFCALLFKALTPILNDTRLVLAVDEIEAGSSICRRFRRGKRDQPGVKRGIVNVYISASSKLRGSLNLGIVAAGTGTSYKTLKSIKSDIGKQDGGVNVTGDYFPLATKEIMNTLLSKLETDVHLGEDTLMLPLSRDFTCKNASSCVEIMSNYCVGARFRLFCGAFEQIKHFVHFDNPLFEALKRSVELHQDRLKELLLERLPENISVADDDTVVSEERSRLLRCLRDVFLASKMSNGAIFLSDYVKFDLTLLGVASRREFSGDYDENHKASINYSVTERFALEVLGELLVIYEGEIDSLKIQFYMGLLDKVLVEYGHKVQFKGNLIETIVLESFRKSLVAKQKLEDLPCLSEVDLGVWKSVCLPPFIGENCCVFK